MTSHFLFFEFRYEHTWCLYALVCVCGCVCVSPGILEVMDDGRAEVIGGACVCVSVHCPPPPLPATVASLHCLA